MQRMSASNGLEQVQKEIDDDTQRPNVNNSNKFERQRCPLLDDESPI